MSEVTLNASQAGDKVPISIMTWTLGPYIVLDITNVLALASARCTMPGANEVIMKDAQSAKAKMVCINFDLLRNRFRFLLI